MEITTADDSETIADRSTCWQNYHHLKPEREAQYRRTLLPLSHAASMQC
jgi:hypothetical protein